MTFEEQVFAAILSFVKLIDSYDRTVVVLRIITLQFLTTYFQAVCTRYSWLCYCSFDIICAILKELT